MVLRSPDCKGICDRDDDAGGRGGEEEYDDDDV